MKKIIVSLVAVMVLAMSLLVGCGNSSSGGNAPETLEGTTWEAVTVTKDGKSYDMDELLKDSAAIGGVTVEFQDGKVIAQFMGQKSETGYTYEEGKLTIEGQTIEVGEDAFVLSMDNMGFQMKKK